MGTSACVDAPRIGMREETGLAGLRVALVHDWLTGMRGGEKCLEVLCRAFPDATLYTLIHRRGALSPAIEAMDDPDVAAPADPGDLPPLSPPAADHAPGRAGLAAAGRRPGDQPEPLRGQGGRAAAGRAARLLLLHADAIRLAGRETYLEGWSRSARCGGRWRGPCSRGCGDWDRRRPGGSRISWRSRRRSAAGSRAATAARAG